MNQLTLEKKEELLKLFYSVPTRQQTLEMCEVAVEKNGMNLQHVSKRLLSPELCVKAIQNNLEAFFLIGKEQMTSEVLAACFDKAREVKSESRIIREIKIKFNRFRGLEFNSLINKDVAKSMVRFKGDFIEYIPKPLRSDMDILMIATKTHGRAISIIPQEEQTRDLVLNAIEGNVSIKRVNPALLDDEIIDLLVKRNSDNFKRLAPEQITYERCLMAVRAGLEIYDIPQKYYSQEIFDSLIELNGSYLSRVPSKYLTKEMILTATKTSVFGFSGLKTDLIDEEFAYQLVNLKVPLCYDCINRCQSQRIVEVAIKNSISDISEAKLEFLGKDVLVESLKHSAYALNYFPKELINEEFCYLAVCQGLDLENHIVVENQSTRIIDKLIEKKFFELKPSEYFKRDKKIALVKKEFLTKDFFKKVLKMNKYALEAAPEDVLDEELCYLAVCQGYSLKESFMKNYQSQRIVNKVFEMGDKSLKNVKAEFMTKELIEEAVKALEENIKYIPEQLLTEELCYLYVSSGHSLITRDLRDYQSQRVADKAFENNTNEITFICDEFKTKEMSLKAFEADCSLVAEIPEQFTTAEMWLEAIKEYDYLFNYAPEKLLTSSNLCLELVKYDWRMIIRIPSKYHTPEIAMVAYEQNETAVRYISF